MPAVRIPAVALAALAALALLPATAPAADVTVTGDDGDPVAIGTAAPTAIRNMDVTAALTVAPSDGAYWTAQTIGPDGVVASGAVPCRSSRVVPTGTDLVAYRGNGVYTVRLRTFSNAACTAGARERRFLYAVHAGTAIAPPGGLVLTREPDSSSTIVHKVPVALNPGAGRYEIRFARGGVIGPDGAISGPSAEAFPHRATGLADVRFREPGRYVMVARAGSGDFHTPWSAPIAFDVKAPFDLASVSFPDSRGPSYKLRATLREAFARGSRVTVHYAKGRKGGKFRRLGRSSRVDAKGRFTLRFALRRTGVHRLQYRFKGTSLVARGRVTEAIRIRRTARSG